MITLLRSFNSISLILLLVYTLGLQANLLVYPVEWLPESASNIYNLLVPALEFLSFGNYYILLGIFVFLLFTQALLVNLLVNASDFTETKTSLPGLAYVLLISLFNKLLFLSPAFFALFFVIFGFARLLQLHRDKSYTHVFDTGFFVAMAGLFYQPAFLLVFLVPYGLFQASILEWKAWATSFIGFLTPLYLMGIYFLLAGVLDISYFNSALGAWSFVDLSILTNNLMLVKMGLMLCLFLASLFIVSRRFLKSTIQIRRYLNLLLAAVILSFAISLFAGGHLGQALSLVIVPLSILAGYFFYELRRGMVVELIHLACLTAVIVFQFTVDN